MDPSVNVKDLGTSTSVLGPTSMDPSARDRGIEFEVPSLATMDLGRSVETRDPELGLDGSGCRHYGAVVGVLDVA